MKSLMPFLQCVLQDMESRCRISTTLDFKTIKSRYEDEGLSFLTITLPKFGKSLQKGIDQGFVDRHLFPGFQRKGGLPRFLGGFLDLIFDRATGRLLDEPDVDAIFCIRQLTLMFAKIGLECTSARIDAAFTQFLECEQDVRYFDSIRTPQQYEEFDAISKLLWRDLFTELDRKIYYGEIVPKHGPGQTADRLMGNQKYYQEEWTERLEEYFPLRENLFTSWRSMYDQPATVVLEPAAERAVKLTAVAKTLDSPRLIAIEPTCMQYMQQGILEQWVAEIEKDYVLRNLVGILEQAPNQELARAGSITGSLATLDLKEASDRVSNQLVRYMLRNHPHLSGGVDACRSRKVDVPRHGVKRLVKFASMGSALCFPFEAMVFCTLVFLGIQDVLNRPLTKKDVKSFLGQVRIYGDDIIVPVEYVQSVSSRLETFGFRVNADKSFWTGKFRESCGKDYYEGTDVTTTKVRTLLPTSRKDAKEIVSTVSLRNQLYKAGFWWTVRFLDNWIGNIIPFPFVGDQSPAVGRHSFLAIPTDSFDPSSGVGGFIFGQRVRMDRDLQRPLVRAMQVSSHLPVNIADGYAALLKFFLNRKTASDSYLSVNEEHLRRSGRPRSVDIKARWTSLF